jgi:adenylosuccinate lyase
MKAADTGLTYWRSTAGASRNAQRGERRRLSAAMALLAVQLAENGAHGLVTHIAEEPHLERLRAFVTNRLGLKAELATNVAHQPTVLDLAVVRRLARIDTAP